MKRKAFSSYAAIFRALLAKKCTLHDLMNVSGLSYDSVQMFMSTLCSRPRQARVCEWALDCLGRPSVKVYELGTEPDVPKPRPKTGAQRQQAYKERKQRLAITLLTQAWSSTPHGLDISTQTPPGCHSTDTAAAPCTDRTPAVPS